MQEPEAPTAWDLLKTTVIEWTADNASHLAAALAYYTIFSIAPLLVIALALAGQVWGREIVRGQIADQVLIFTNSPGLAELVGTISDNATSTQASLVATVVGFVALFYGATGVFTELKGALNHIWDVPTRVTGGIFAAILSRLVSLLMVLISGLLLLASLIITTVLSGAADWVNQHWPGMAFTTQVVNFLVFYVVTGVVFALVYKYVPDVRIAWRDVLIGAVATALLFSVGRWLLSLYLSRTTIASIYGAAGSFIVLLLWIYYSAQVFFLGAEFTQVYARTYGTRQRERPILAEDLPESEAPTVGSIVVLDDPSLEQAAPVAKARWRPPLRRWGRAAARPLADVALAVGIIALLSIYNFVREPFRKE
jgi:membrane protein